MTEIITQTSVPDDTSQATAAKQAARARRSEWTQLLERARAASHLHAIAAAWSLHTARGRLLEVVEQEARQQRSDALVTAAAANLQAWRPAVGHGSGSHGDPTSTSVIGVADTGARAFRPRRYGRLRQRTTDTLQWLAESLGCAGFGDPLGQIRQHIPRIQPGTAGELHRWIAELDHRIRTALTLDSKDEPLAGTQCPACERRPLRALPAGPDSSVIVCRPDCLCAGDGCLCQMPTRAEGVAHIWAKT